MIVEYKMVREMDQTRAPSWVLDSGYFQNPADFTMVGTTKNDDVREFYLPDSVVRLSRQELITRMLGINENYPMQKMTAGSMEMTSMSDADVTDMVNQWCDARGEP